MSPEEAEAQRSVPAVAVVMRTRNRPRFLARGLEDVARQSYDDWFLVIVNDGGDPVPVQDAVDAQADDLAGRVAVHNIPDQVGRWRAANAGVRASESEFIALHDDDDTWHPDFLTRTVDFLRSSGRASVAVRTALIHESIGDDGTLVETGREVFHPSMQEPTYFDLLRFNHVVPISLLYRRSVHERLGSFNEGLSAVGDWEFNLRLALDAPIGFIDGEPLAFWHLRREASGDVGNSMIASLDDHVRFDRRVRDEHVRDFAQAYGPGPLLYLAKYVDERTQEIHARLDELAARQDEVLAHLQWSWQARTREGLRSLRSRARRG